ncbi:MAG: NnrS family protein [Arenicellales bacterium]
MSSPTDSTQETTALFNLGFRPFFLAAALFAVLSMIAWAAVYLFNIELSLKIISPYQWHAHEMIFGYAMAVIAGFLLTAVKNWTGIQTLQKTPLALLFALWLCARTLFMLGYIPLAGVFDLSFLLFLNLAILSPILKAKQWKQIAIVSKLILLLLFNLLFYLGAMGWMQNGLYLGLYGALYTMIGLILTMGRRVIPFFISKGVAQNVDIKNSKILDISSLIFFLAFTAFELFYPHQIASAYLAIALFVINAVRLFNWHTPGIWQRPLLWSLYCSLCFICLGFLMFAGAYFFNYPYTLAIHAFTYGGIGALTLAMMSRVALGHTGRSIAQPAPMMSIAFIIIFIGGLCRTLLPLALPEYYKFWVGVSQLLWIAGFCLFVGIYYPILMKNRIDGKAG